VHLKSKKAVHVLNTEAMTKPLNLKTKPDTVSVKSKSSTLNDARQILINSWK